MKIKALFLTLALLCGAVSAGAAGIDVVVMVDTSESMFPVFDDVVNYLLRDLLENRLHGGDSFHLLSFADSPEQEIRLDLESRADVSAMVERILLLRPLGQYTDLVAAVEFLYEYTLSLSEHNQKLVLLLTDGIHDPPPGSPNRMEEKDVLARLLESSEKIRQRGWDVHILRMPGEEVAQLPGGSGQDVLEELSEQLGTDVVDYEDVDKEDLTDQLTGFSTVRFPGPVGRVRRFFSATFSLQNNASQDLRYSLTAVDHATGQMLRRRISVSVPAGGSADFNVPLRVPAGLNPGPATLNITLDFLDPPVRTSPLQGTLSLNYQPLVGWQGAPIPLSYLLYALGALLLIAVIILLIFVIRHRMQDAAFDRLFAGAADQRKGRPGRRPLILRVDTQNPNIGTRNIHSVPPGTRRSVGGDGSTFLIYFVPMPRRIGYIRNDGKKYRFIPKKSEHFPDLSKPLEDCLNKPIPAVSSRGREVVFHFHEYVSPLEQLNRLMRSVPKYHVGDIALKH